MQYEVARSNMAFIAEQARAGFLENCGVSKGDFERVTSDKCWLGIERPRMTAALQSLMYAAVDAQGLPRFALPAEYHAAVISVFVHPSNCMAACNYLATTSDTENMARRPDSQNMSKSTVVPPDQLFAICTDLYRDSVRSSSRQLFEKRTGLALEALKKDGVK